MANKFTGLLAEPIDPRLSPTEKAVLKLHKLHLLSEYYNVPEENADGEPNYLGLLLSVCSDFVPGLASPKIEKRGRPKTSPADKLVLWNDVTKLRDERKCSVSEALSLLVKSRKSPWYGKKKRTLENSLHNMWRDPMVYAVMTEMEFGVHHK